MDNIDQRIEKIENTLERHSERLLKVESKLEKDYTAIMALIEDVKALKAASQANSEMTARLISKVQELDTAFNDFMERVQKYEESNDLKYVGIIKKLDKQNKLLWAAIVIAVGSVIYATIRWTQSAPLNVKWVVLKKFILTVLTKTSPHKKSLQRFLLI